MLVLLFVSETLSLSTKNVETRFLPHSIMLKWRGLRELGALLVDAGGAVEDRAPRGPVREQVEQQRAVAAVLDLPRLLP